MLYNLSKNIIKLVSNSQTQKIEKNASFHRHRSKSTKSPVLIGYTPAKFDIRPHCRYTTAKSIYDRKVSLWVFFSL